MTVTDAPPAAVVWWKTRLAMIEVPRRHIIGWSDTTGSPSGTIDIVSPHPRLDRRIIETALAEELADRYPTLPRFGTAAELAAHLSAEARLRAAGHQVVSRDLASVYGLGVVGGVVATLLGKGIDAYVLIDAHAGPAIRSAVCAEAENALNEFETATPSQLDEDGWEPGNEGRWQLFLEQT